MRFCLLLGVACGLILTPLGSLAPGPPPMPVLASAQVGIASWYGGVHDGRLTASGEVFREAELTAAHPRLPLGSIVEVRSLTTGVAVTVRINDRGPFVGQRVIDLSRGAAERIFPLCDGLGPVMISALSAGGQ